MRLGYASLRDTQATLGGTFQSRFGGEDSTRLSAVSLEARRNLGTWTLSGSLEAASARIDQLDVDVSRSGAMQSAMSMMSASAAGIRETNRLAVGAGFQGGQNALSIGFQRALSDKTTFTLGGAFSGGQSTIGIGYGMGW